MASPSSTGRNSTSSTSSTSNTHTWGACTLLSLPRTPCWFTSKRSHSNSNTRCNLCSNSDSWTFLPPLLQIRRQMLRTAMQPGPCPPPAGSQQQPRPLLQTQTQQTQQTQTQRWTPPHHLTSSGSSPP